MSLPLRSWKSKLKPERAILIALHGFNDYSKAFEKPAAWWAANGLTTYAFDQRGFGEAPHAGLWSTTETMAMDLADAVEAISSNHPDTPVYIIGSSMGAAVILCAAAQHGSAFSASVKGVILVGPAVWGPRVMNPFLRGILWLGAHIMPANHLTGEGLRIKPSDNIEMLRALGRDPLVIKSTRVDALYGLVQLMGDALDYAPGLSRPALVLAAARDELVPGHAHRELLSALQNQRTEVVYPRGFHMLLRDLQAEVVWKDILAWVENPDTPLPSGLGRKIKQR